MAEELDFTGQTEVDPPRDAEDTAPASEIADQLGQHGAFDWTDQPIYTSHEVVIPDEFDDDGGRDLSPLSEDARKALMSLDNIYSKADIAPRRIEIQQAWKADHYFRGYQFLLPMRNGGWTMPGAGNYSAGNQQQTAQLYQTNVYGEKGEIIIAALAREVPRVEFFPANPDYPPDQDMADVASDLKDIWAKNNNLQSLLRDTAEIFWNEDRCLYWTRYELNGDEYGYEEEDEPVVPEDETNPPVTPTGTDSDNQYREENESVVPPTAKRRPRGRVRTSSFGKLAHKVPIYINARPQMPYAIVYEDKDVADAKAQFPWMKEKIHGGGDGTGETELDRIARENVQQAVSGQYVTGDSLNRHCVVKHVYLRRSTFFDDSVREDVRNELLEKFPDGVVLVKASTEFAFARNECLDDHITIGHPFPGKGQNRRALGESLLPIQDYINELVSLALDFAKRTVAKKWMDADAFNIEALRAQTNVPGSIGPFRSQPGKSVDQLIFIEPTPTPQPWMVSWIQWIITSLSEQISGALPSLFGAQITGQVGSEGVATQRDQAMQRQGCPWNSIQQMFAEAARQAAMLTARCANKDIKDVIPGKGPVDIKLNMLRGSVLCYPEANPDIPESWSQKETRTMEIVDHASANPGSPVSQSVLTPKNLKLIKSAIRLPGFIIKGESSVVKQEAEIELLLRSGPLPNPQKMQGQQMLAKLQQQLLVGAQSGAADPQQLQQLQQAAQQAEQQIAAMPDFISSVHVRGDGSEDDGIEADICFDWMNSADGRKFSYGTPQQQQAFENVHLHWKEHTDSAKAIAAQNAPPPPPPRVSFSVPVDKLPAPEAAAAVTAGGVPANPEDFGAHADLVQNREIQKRVVPDQVYLDGIHKDASNTSVPKNMR